MYSDQVVKNNPWNKPLEFYGYDNTFSVFGGDLFEAETDCFQGSNVCVALAPRKHQHEVWHPTNTQSIRGHEHGAWFCCCCCCCGGCPGVGAGQIASDSVFNLGYFSTGLTFDGSSSDGNATEIEPLPSNPDVPANYDPKKTCAVHPPCQPCLSCGLCVVVVVVVCSLSVASNPIRRVSD